MNSPKWTGLAIGCAELIVKTIFVAFLLSSGADGQRPSFAQSWLSGLDLSKPASLCVARERFESRFSHAGPQKQAEALFEPWNFYGKSVGANQDAIGSLGEGLSWDQFSSLLSALRAKRTEAGLAAVRASLPEVWRRMEPWLTWSSSRPASSN